MGYLCNSRIIFHALLGFNLKWKASTLLHSLYESTLMLNILKCAKSVFLLLALLSNNLKEQKSDCKVIKKMVCEALVWSSSCSWTHQTPPQSGDFKPFLSFFLFTKLDHSHMHDHATRKTFFITYRFVQLPWDLVFLSLGTNTSAALCSSAGTLSEACHFSTHENVTFHKRAFKNVALLFDQILTESVLCSASMSHFWSLNRAATKMVTVCTN